MHIYSTSTLNIHIHIHAHAHIHTPMVMKFKGCWRSGYINFWLVEGGIKKKLVSLNFLINDFLILNINFKF